MRMLADDDDDVAPAASTKSQTSQQPAWMRSLLDRCQEWLSQLPSVSMPWFLFARVLIFSQKFNTLPQQAMITRPIVSSLL